jgi:hypothetical protein
MLPNWSETFFDSPFSPLFLSLPFVVPNEKRQSNFSLAVKPGWLGERVKTTPQL